MSYKDKPVPCRDCGGQFIFTAGEQEFYAQKGFTNEPTRCIARRRARKQGEGSDVPLELPCPYDVSKAQAAAPRSSEAPRREPRARQEREAYTGELPEDAVLAHVLNVDPGGRFMFVRVDDPGFDVYVHASLFMRLGVLFQPGDAVWVTVERSDRGVRARTLQLD